MAALSLLSFPAVFYPHHLIVELGGAFLFFGSLVAGVIISIASFLQLLNLDDHPRRGLLQFFMLISIPLALFPVFIIFMFIYAVSMGLLDIMF